MSKKYVGSVCAGLFAMSVAASASADTVNVLFGNASGDSVNYSFTTSGVADEIFDSAIFNVGGVVTSYTSADYNLVRQ